MLLAIPFGLLIGLIIGAVGGGGAILALPVLVYVLGEGVGPASTASLIVVAVAAAIGAGVLARAGTVCWSIAIGFSIPAAAGAWVGAIANAAVSPEALIVAFVPVMLLAALTIWRRSDAPDEPVPAECPDPPWGLLVLGGLAVGVATGFFGVGGGFLIVPVLTVAIGMEFHRAIATSLVIISVTGVAALISHIATSAGPDVPVTVLLAGSTAVGAVIGTTVGQRLPQRTLGRNFALVVVAVASMLLLDVLVFGGPPTG